MTNSELTLVIPGDLPIVSVARILTRLSGEGYRLQEIQSAPGLEAVTFHLRNRHAKEETTRTEGA